jgi:hypothetical protein
MPTDRISSHCFLQTEEEIALPRAAFERPSTANVTVSVPTRSTNGGLNPVILPSGLDQLKLTREKKNKPLQFIKLLVVGL